MHSLKSVHLIGQNFRILSRFRDRDNILLDHELISSRVEYLLKVLEFVILYPTVPYRESESRDSNKYENMIPTLMQRIIFLLKIDLISLHVTYPCTSLLSVMYLNWVSCCSIACDNSFSHWRSLYYKDMNIYILIENNTFVIPIHLVRLDHWNRHLRQPIQNDFSLFSSLIQYLKQRLN